MGHSRVRLTRSEEKKKKQEEEQRRESKTETMGNLVLFVAIVGRSQQNSLYKSAISLLGPRYVLNKCRIKANDNTRIADP